ncbi:MAG: hypothetical protein HY551_05910, partial [Elusimicrobia bacterium]|nr:hypothetical protein [Elusimicrobiota bacterium]
MTELRLDVHGISVLLACDHPVVLESLRRDFAYFEAGPADTRPHIRWTLHADGARRIAEPARRAAFHMRDFAVFDEGSTRFVRYEDGALAVYDYGARSGHLYCGDPERLHELSYLAVLSRVGEDLDRRKLHRLHALGFEYKGWAGFILLPSGGGKSTLALELIRSSGLGIVSEDTPILSHQMRARAFPLRWGFAPSVDLSSVPKELIRLFRRKRHG